MTRKTTKLDPAAKKFELLVDDTIPASGCRHTLYRIRALRDVGTRVQKGDLGGYVQSEQNLSHQGTCWVGGNARVYDGARVLDDALVTDEARVFGAALVREKAIVEDSAHVYDQALVTQSARVSGNSVVRDHATISYQAMVFGNAEIEGHATVCSYARVWADARITGRAHVGGNVQVSGRARLGGDIFLMGAAAIDGTAVMQGFVRIDSTEVRISKPGDIVTFDGLGTTGELITAYRSKATGVELVYRRFRGTIANFRLAVEESKLADDAKSAWQLLGMANLIEHHFAA